MVAIYARKSVENIDSISIETQIDECKKELRAGDECEIFADNGFSGKDTDRPQLQKMLEKISSGEVSRVIVYKLDRISRSLPDFIGMMDDFQAQKVEFTSHCEKFDTSSAMGRTVMAILAVFAQFERETIQARIIDAYRYRSRKGFFMGGKTPYGYRTAPIIIDGVHTSSFVEYPPEADVIRRIYRMYGDEGETLGGIISELKDKGILTDGKMWSRGRVSDIIRNPVYLKADVDAFNFFLSQGAVMANPPEEFDGRRGCYYFKGDNSRRKQTSLDGNMIVLAPHEGLIDSELWLRCRVKLMQNRQVCNQPSVKNTWLAGKVKCAKCGYALIDKRYKNRNVRYLFCSHRMDSKGCQGPGLLHTDEVEDAVFEAIKLKLAEFKTISKKRRERVNPEASALNIELAEINRKMQAYVDKIPDADGELLLMIQSKFAALEKRKGEIRRRIGEIEATEKTDFIDVTHHVENWELLTFNERRTVTDALIKVIHVDSENLTIEWRV